MGLKFEDCRSCRFRNTRRGANPCASCDMGEFFEDRDRAGVDAVFQEPPTRFGESITTDEQNEEQPDE